MAVISELGANMIVLVTWPFALIKFSVRTAFVVLVTWIELVRAATDFHINLVCGFIMWTTALVTLPIRVLSALRREGQLEQLLHSMQSDMDHLVWEQIELQKVLQTAVEERKMLELILTELEDEHDMAIAKIEELEGKLQLLRHVNLRLKEIEGKSHWNFGNGDQTAHIQKPGDSNYGTTYMISLLKSGHNGNGVILRDLLIHADMMELNKFLKSGPESGPFCPKVLDQHREAALWQSFFSAILSLLVGIVIWQAEDSCMPLVLALFAVVFMSLKSVVQFFSTIKNKPASDAVALMSFNWFILGTLAYPTLPKIARVLSPVLSSLLNRAIKPGSVSYFPNLKIT